MANTDDEKEFDSLGRERLPSERYSQAGGSSGLKFIVWRCKVCSRVYPARSRSARFDSKCRQCGTRNTIKFVGESGSWIQGRERVTQFWYYPDYILARDTAIKSNKNWMKRRLKIQYQKDGFTTADLLNECEGSVDHHGRDHPLRQLDS